METISHAKNLSQVEKFPVVEPKTSPLDAALAYARAEIPVFPCKNKRPLTTRGFKDATCDATLIKAWWSKHPDAEVAMPTGTVSGVWVLDVDAYKPEGRQSFDALVKEHGKLPKTRTAKTGSGGLQLFFRYPGRHVKTVAGRPWKCIDIKGDGGYVVMPPSVRPDGGVYSWIDQADVADAPDWLLDVVTSKQKQPRLSEPHEPRPVVAVTNEFLAGLGEDWNRIEAEGVDEGERNITLARLAGYLLGTGVEEAEAYKRCKAFADRCRPPIDEEEFDRTFYSIEAREEEQRAKVQVTISRALEAAKTDKSAPFKPEVVEAIVALQAKDSAAWQATRDKFKKAGVRVGELDKEIKKRISALKSRKPDSARFVVKDGVICEIKPTKFGDQVVALCNFNARIVRGECRDDGLDRRTWAVIHGTLADGTPLPETKVLARDFAPMRWVDEAWITQAYIMSGRDTRDCLRTAIQVLSGQPPLQTIYTHLGWRFVEGLGWMYLHAGGAIGASGPVADVLVDPDGRLGDYHLPDPPGGDALAKAVRASIRTLSVAPTRITYPLFAAVYRAPLAEAEPVDLSVFLAGPTGVKKSSVSGVFQAHYGSKFSDRHLPASWTSTANALERLAFLAKDAVLTVDDFAPRGTVNSVNMLHQLADRVLRGQGNRSSRDRMRPDTSLRQGYAPRGLILATGEDIPQGESLRARGLILELGREDVDLKKLTEAQRDADEGLLAQAMAGYVRWLAPRMDDLKKTLHGRYLELREEVRSHSLSHDRTPGIIANLALGAESFLKFAQAVGALTEEEAKAVWDGGWQALMEAGKNQKTFLQSEDPVGRFMNLIMSAMASGRAHVADFETGQTPRVDEPTRWGWRTEFGAAVKPAEFSVITHTQTYQPLGTRIGWMASGELWLDPEAAFAEAQELARRQGTTLPVTQATLWKRMKDRGLLIPEQDGAEMRLKARRVVEGHRRRLVVIPAGFYHNAVQQDVH